MCDKCLVRARKIAAYESLKRELLSLYDYEGVCGFHPKYKAIKQPRKTKKFPKGCPICWALYKLKG